MSPYTDHRTGLTRRKGLARTGPLRSRGRPLTGIRVWIRATQSCEAEGCRIREGCDPSHADHAGMGGTADQDGLDERGVSALCRAHHTAYDRLPESEKLVFRFRRGRTRAEVDGDTLSRWMALPVEERKWWDKEAERIDNQRGPGG